MIVYEDIQDGDLLGCSARYAWIRNPVTAFYSSIYTPENIRDGQITFRTDGTKYGSVMDCHSLPAKYFTKINTEILGDNDDDCI